MRARKLSLRLLHVQNVLQYIITADRTSTDMRWITTGCKIMTCLDMRVCGSGKYIALDVARGLNYLHASKILHLDLKSPNVLLSAEFEAKISDVVSACAWSMLANRSSRSLICILKLILQRVCCFV